MRTVVDREKVIKALERCATKGCGCDDEEGCPYNKGMDYACVGELVADALALLKAQEPRVMTLEEARSAFVIEYRSGKLKEVGMKILDLDIDPANAYYGVIYRAWTSRPDDETRRATAWE